MCSSDLTNLKDQGEGRGDGGETRSHRALVVYPHGGPDYSEWWVTRATPAEPRTHTPMSAGWTQSQDKDRGAEKGHSHKEGIVSQGPLNLQVCLSRHSNQLCSGSLHNGMTIRQQKDITLPETRYESK